MRNISTRVLGEIIVVTGMMRNISIRALGEITAVIGILLSLIFVGFEIQQSTITARSAAYQEIGIATAQGWLETALNRELIDVLGKAASGPGEYHNLSPSDKSMIRAWLLSFIRLSETIYLQVEQGLLSEQAFDTLGHGDITFAGDLTQSAWPDMRPLITPSFVEFIEDRYEGLSQ